MNSAGGGMNFFLKRELIEAMAESKKIFAFDNEGEYQKNSTKKKQMSELTGIESLEVKQILNGQYPPINLGEKADEAFLGYCFFADGSYCKPVHLDNIKQAVRYITLQKIFQYRVIITDGEDRIVAEAIDGIIIFPKSE